MKALLFMLLVVLTTVTSANANVGWTYVEYKGVKNGDHNIDRNTTKNTNNFKPVRAEEFLLMFPRFETVEKIEDDDLEKAIVDLYKWYLQNETKINTNDSSKKSSNNLSFPFKIDPKTLQQYFLFIKKNFPAQ